MERHKNIKSTVYALKYQPMSTKTFIDHEQKKEKKEQPERYLYLPRKSKLRKVLYTEIPDTVNQMKLGEILEEQWDVSPPEAIIAITGISHQFNIKDKRSLKKELVKAVVSTGSWIVTCGTESGVVQFIEDAVIDHVTSTKIYIPIVGILSKRVLDEVKPLKRVLKVDTDVDGERIRIRTNSTKETLDPNHTQFIVIGDQGIKHPGGSASSECRKAFESFLSNIKVADFKTDKCNDNHTIHKHGTRRQRAQNEKDEILPVVLVLLEGGIEAMETAWRVLANDNPVVVIDGSGGAADFLSACSSCYQRATSANMRIECDQNNLLDCVENIHELITECFEDDSQEKKAKELATLCLKKQKLIRVYSLKEKTITVDELIQDAIFDTYTEYYKTEVSNPRKSTNENDMKINIVQKQLKLVQKWKRCDIAMKDIFKTKNRNQLKDLQTLDEDRMYRLQHEIENLIINVQKRYGSMHADLLAYYDQLKLKRLLITEENDEHNYTVLSTAVNKLVDHVRHMPIEDIKGVANKLKKIQAEFDKERKIMKKNEMQSINTMKEQIETMMIKFLNKYVDIINNLAESYEIFKKSVLQMQSFNEQKLDELEMKIDKLKEKCVSTDEYKHFKDDALQLKKIIKAKNFIDKNKAKYFTDVSKSLTTLMEGMEGEFERNEEQFKEILTEFVDCVDSDDELAIQLIDQHWGKFRKSEEDIEKQEELQYETKKLKAQQKELQNETEELNFKQEALQNEKKKLKAKEEQLNEEVKVNVKLKMSLDKNIKLKEITARLLERKNRKNNKILSAVNNFIIDLFEDTEFKLYDFKGSELDVIYKDKPFHHLFVWAVLVNWREMAMIFWELETDHTCSALFASAILNELADKALFSKHMHLSVSLKENARHFETLACNVMTELYNTNRESALKTLVTKVGRYNSTPLKIAVSQKLNKFMAHTACQAQLNSIWSGDVAVYTPFWRIGMVTFFPILLIQSIGFITMKRKYLTSKQIGPRLDQHADQNQNDNSNNKTGLFLRIFNVLYCVYRFYCAPVTKFFVYMIAYMTFVVIFAIFVLTDLYPLSESPPSLLELATWVWTLSLAIEEIRQILQTNKGSLLKNLKFWAKDVWNIFDITIFIGPKVVMIGRMFGDLGFFIALYALFVFSFGIIYQALLFPNSVSSPWELIKDLVYLPYWQLYGELHLEQIEGKEPTKCTNNPQLYTNGTMERCAVTNQYNALMMAVYLVLTNILLVNILIAMFSQTFQTVQDNSEIIWKFHRYALVYEYYERPMFPIPIVIHLWRIVVFCNGKLRKTKKYGGAFVFDVKPEEIERLHIVEKKCIRNLSERTFFCS
ncbi:TRPM1 [Mytilus edulis]|uniref:TRPM1 n=1 Tax=Mytilus edulis TaxID=6550 RepID=A0A8S3UVS0_MYTED|nr:TRPM1 [Mytilus edulis]